LVNEPTGENSGGVPHGVVGVSSGTIAVVVDAELRRGSDSIVEKIE
jgi:hypothetical protein